MGSPLQRVPDTEEILSGDTECKGKSCFSNYSIMIGDSEIPEICSYTTKTFIYFFLISLKNKLCKKCLYSPEKDCLPGESSAESSLSLKENFILLQIIPFWYIFFIFRSWMHVPLYVLSLCYYSWTTIYVYLESNKIINQEIPLHFILCIYLWC